MFPNVLKYIDQDQKKIELKCIEFNRLFVVKDRNRNRNLICILAHLMLIELILCFIPIGKDTYISIRNNFTAHLYGNGVRDDVHYTKSVWNINDLFAVASQFNGEKIMMKYMLLYML